MADLSVAEQACLSQVDLSAEELECSLQVDLSAEESAYLLQESGYCSVQKATLRLY